MDRAARGRREALVAFETDRETDPAYQKLGDTRGDTRADTPAQRDIAPRRRRPRVDDDGADQLSPRHEEEGEEGYDGRGLAPPVAAAATLSVEAAEATEAVASAAAAVAKAAAVKAEDEAVEAEAVALEAEAAAASADLASGQVK